MEKILSDKNISSGAKLVLLNLVSRIGGKDFAFPSQKRIARDVGLSDRQVRNLLKELKEKVNLLWCEGAVNPETNKKLRSNKYVLTDMLRERMI